jgi:prepilin-type N-terminal cleavage/methylation domain-containing protein
MNNIATAFKKGFTPLQALKDRISKISRGGEACKERLVTGFTLVELLIVIAILAVLAAAVVIVLNPAELLAQARDSQRVNDLDTVKNALSIYISQTSSIDLGGCSVAALTYGRCTAAHPGNKAPFGAIGAANTCEVVAANNVTGTGWVDVNFSIIPGGSPIPYLPVDPSNTTNYFYGYACSESPNYVFELNGRLESQKHRIKMPFDGGNKNCLCGGAACTSANAGNMTTTESQAADCFYELGTDAGLDI